MNIAQVKREASALRLRELWDVLPPGIPARHPLQGEWTLWYLKGDRSKDWVECLREVVTFDSIEGFWSVFNHIIQPTSLSWGSDFYLFRKGIKPMWEDESNVAGGRWLVNVEKQKCQQVLDHYWMEMLMAITGERFEEDGDEICGAVVNVRQKGDKVALWTHDAANDSANFHIGEVLFRSLKLDEKTDVIRYEVHKDASVRTGSQVKPRIVLPAHLMKNVNPAFLESISSSTIV